MQRIHHHIKRHYKKLAAIAGVACLSAYAHGIGVHLPNPYAKPLSAQKAPTMAQDPQENASSSKNSMGSSERTIPIAEQTPQENIPLRKQLTPQKDVPSPSDNHSALQPSNSKPPTPKPPYERAFEMTATAYAPGPQDNDQWGTKTHLGTEVRPGVIAVDPRVIPLGSRVMIKYPNGHTEYAVAEDTGGAIKGRRIDVAKWTETEANRFGIQPVKVYVLKTPTKENTPGI
jgi:3D (Asp-Asp-Asp) domain-containing protein